jgi:hypothetical protein
VTINLTANAGPLTVQWVTPWNYQYLSAVQFPFNVSFRIDDFKGVKKLKLLAVNQNDQTEEFIGTVENPVLPNMSMNWNMPASYGKYILKIVATLTSGDDRVSEMIVNVMQ